jgi:polysaccharide pyruvyl transferase WcaK-like protein
MTTAEDQRDLVARLDRIQNLTDELAKCQHDAIEQIELATRIHREILAAKRALVPAK